MGVKESGVSSQIEEFWKERKNIEIKGLLTIEEIKHYFSFLYTEVPDRDKPTMRGPISTEEAVNHIFAHGLVIPAIPLEEKFKFNSEPRFPKKIVAYAIHKFFSLYSILKRDKATYLVFLEAT